MIDPKCSPWGNYIVIDPKCSPLGSFVRIDPKCLPHEKRFAIVPKFHNTVCCDRFKMLTIGEVSQIS